MTTHTMSSQLQESGRADVIRYPDVCIHVLIEQQVLVTPDAIAVRFDGAQLSYATLDERANRLANDLRAKGVGPEQVVGICLRPSLHAVVAVLAILKAGGAYLSLSLGDPVARLVEVLTDSRPRLVVTTSDLADRFRNDLASMPVHLVDQEPTGNSSRLGSRVGLDHAAFVRYTSGSTGRPKGVLNTHRSIVSRIASRQLPDIQDDDVCALSTSLGYGARLFYPLALGATVVLFGDAQLQDVTQLARWLATEQVTSIYMVPTLLRQLLDLDAAALAPIRALRAVTAGGETLTSDIIERFHRLVPNVLLINVYGSNEIGTTAAMRIVSSDSTSDWRSIGRSVANSRIYVLDEAMNVVEADGVGEIVVGSAHLARGYLGRPGVTAERFVPDPFGSSAGGRLYRTGDLGRVRADGAIEFQGRVDHQVKIRGFRVECEEVERMLRRHPDVHDVAVVLRQFDEGSRLIAFVEGTPSATLNSLQLREHTRRHLPEYMVPSAIVVLHQLPRGRSGKVDRETLRSFELSRSSAADYIAPRSTTEAALVRIWIAVFEVEGIGVDDDFLDLGGDSLAAMRITSQIWRDFGVELPATVLFDLATISHVAAHISSLKEPGTAFPTASSARAV
jgi:amino acid adenylation domain-containing protein